MVAIAGLVTLQDGTELFAKTLLGPDQNIFPVESIGLSDLHDLGGANTPDVLCASPRLLVLEKMQPRRDDEHFWEQLASMLATLHMSTASERFGWHRDGWLGRLRQDNTWETDGHTFSGNGASCAGSRNRWSRPHSTARSVKPWNGCARPCPSWFRPSPRA